MKRFVSFALILVFGQFILSCKPEIVEDVVGRWEDGSKKVVRYYIVDDDVRVLHREQHFYPDGTLRIDGSFLKGRRHGRWVSYYENGDLWSEGKYVNGQQEGKWTIWHRSGFRHYEGSYRAGRKNSRWTFWDENGVMIKEESYP